MAKAKSCRTPVKNTKLAKCLVGFGRKSTAGPQQAIEACSAIVARKKKAPKKTRTLRYREGVGRGSRVVKRKYKKTRAPKGGGVFKDIFS